MIAALPWHAEAVNGLDPETGRLLWSIPWKLNYGMAIPTPRQWGDELFLSCFYNGSLMLRFATGTETPEAVWRTAKMSERDTTHLNCTMATPFIDDGCIYGPCSYGQFRCLRADTGERVWSFQTVHHDLWDYDVASSPVLFDVHKAGRTIPAVGVGSKTGNFFILDRLTGAPISESTPRSS